ncbi:hypothetical protein VMCG_06088 [Cytospora schulzeri]|uniref:ELYS-like domain-containing protein n=1 Tax=Cytospora schulzeri TaxID=448051 RepID=A0A423WG42_9PEZI|nr:hypothetical protein VMCG_06088 [Valsa malicola]
MPDFNDYRQVFKPEWGSPYTQEFSRQTDIYRKRLNGSLFMDRVLRALGITKSKSYPPKGDDGLYQLHQKICDSQSSVHQKLSVFYYLLLDFNEHLGSQTRTSFADIFAGRFAVPKKYETFMKGLWNMDRQQFNLALEDLAHPSLSQEFSDDIIITLVQNAEHDDYSLALAYYHTVKPVLDDPSALEHLFEAMSRTSLVEAFYFARTHPEQTRRLLFEQLMTSVLEGRGSIDTATRATELVSLPLDSAEEQWFEDYLTNGDGRKLRKAKDTVLMRRVVTGRHADSAGNKDLGGQWGVVLGGFKSGMGGRVA